MSFEELLGPDLQKIPTSSEVHGAHGRSERCSQGSATLPLHVASTFRRSHRGEAGGHQSMRAACGRVCGVSIRLSQLLRCWQRRVRNVQSADFYYVPSSASLKGKARPRVEGSSVSSLRVRSCACHQGWARLGCKRSRLWSVAEVQLKSSYQKKRKRSSGLSLLRSLFRVLDQASSKQAAM